MEVFYDYNIDHLTPVGDFDDRKMVDLLFNEALPGVEVNIQAPNFGSTAFSFRTEDGKVYMGRNYDFKFDTSAMMCYCHPKDSNAKMNPFSGVSRNARSFWVEPVLPFCRLTRILI